MDEHLYLLTICLPFATILLVFGMRYGSAVMQAKANRQNDAAWQDMLTALDDIKTRLAGIEKILKDVE